LKKNGLRPKMVLCSLTQNNHIMNERNLSDEDQVRSARVRPDKSLLAEEIRQLFIATEKCSEHLHEKKEVRYFPRRLRFEDIGGEKVFFVPVENGQGECLMPIFMLNLDEEQKQEIKRYSRSLLGFHMATDKYFKKPQIALSYESRDEYAEDDVVIIDAVGGFFLDPVGV